MITLQNILYHGTTIKTVAFHTNRLGRYQFLANGLPPSHHPDILLQLGYQDAVHRACRLARHQHSLPLVLLVDEKAVLAKVKDKENLGGCVAVPYLDQREFIPYRPREGDATELIKGIRGVEAFLSAYYRRNGQKV